MVCSNAQDPVFSGEESDANLFFESAKLTRELGVHLENLKNHQSLPK